MSDRDLLCLIKAVEYEMRRLTMKRFFLFAIPFFLLVFLTFNIVTAASDTLCVCHVEKKTGKGHVIEVDKDSLEGHLKHGDIQCTVDCETVVGKSCNVSSKGECK
jgi:hypothetical protein